jgi:hypothetical protein
MPRKRSQRAVVAILVIVAFLIPTLAILASGGSGHAGATADPSGGCDHWCGNGWATVTVGGTTTKVPGGGCYDEGVSGVDARFGDWLDGSFDYVGLVFFRPGTATPTGAAADSQNDMASYPSGSVAGLPFVLDKDSVIHVDSNGTGTFSGKDINDGHAVAGTFNCG